MKLILNKGLYFFIFINLSVFLLFSGCQTENAISSDTNEEVTEQPELPPVPPEPDNIIYDSSIFVDRNVQYQVIDGFGGALPMWTGQNGMLKPEEVQKLVGMGDDELGISLIRTIIAPKPENWKAAVVDLQVAKSYGDNVQILATPWSPPAALKDNNSTTDGGKLLPEFYGDYVSHLNGYVQYMKDNNIDIDVVSLQNEPDWHPNYDSCDWSGEEFKTFLAEYGAQLTAPKVLVGESLRFNRDLTDPSLEDAEALPNFEIVGGHLYDGENSGNLSPYPLAEEKGKARWMTEYLVHDADGEGAPIWGGGGYNKAVWDETLDEMLRTVHLSMESNWNAYIWWWMKRFYSFMGDGNSKYGTTRSEILKRGWAFSQYAKFVRPGYTRIDAWAEGGGGRIEATAYQGEGKTVLVMLNRSKDEYQNLIVDLGFSSTSAKAYITSQFDNRKEIEVLIDDNMAVLPVFNPRSVVTLVIE